MRYEDYALLPRTASSNGTPDGTMSFDVELEAAEDSYLAHSRPSALWPLRRLFKQRHILRLHNNGRFEPARLFRKHSRLTRLCCLLYHLWCAVVVLVVIFGIFIPSYSNPPQRYSDLRARVLSNSGAGAANPHNEKVFIAATLYDRQGQLVSGDWGLSVKKLIDILGTDNVFLSLYENDPDEDSKQALDDFRGSLSCESSIVSEHLDLTQLPRATLPDGSQRLRRIAFLAEVRNRALLPLVDATSGAYHTRWDKLLYLNDVAFDPVDAANLLLNTNVDKLTGKTQYRAACAVDFINPFKFYDTFATRDLEGYSMGVPFFPWFTGAGAGTSRSDVLSQTDAVRVTSCWGGMVAFEARWFQPRLHKAGGDEMALQNEPHPDTGSVKGFEEAEKVLEPKKTLETSYSRKAEGVPPASENSDSTETPNHLLAPRPEINSTTVPPRFRSETELYIEASECCLIHADLASRGPHPRGTNNTGIYLNPYIRTAYSTAVLAWLPFTRRFERLYTPVHSLVNIIAKLPVRNARRLEQPGDEVVQSVWQWDEDSLAALQNGTVGDLANGLQGSYQTVTRTVRPGQLCGVRQLSYLKDQVGDGERSWESVKAPPGY